MTMLSQEQLHDFIVKAKAATYVGSGEPSPACRPKSHDLGFQDGDFTYLDSYFGGQDFIGEEVVYYQGEPVWAMNYYGRILNPKLIAAAEAGAVIKESLTEMYKEGRFLGGFEYETELGKYFDTSEGEMDAFTGREWIERAGVVVYELVYHGGMIK
ncbi:MAG: hypothetical protein JXB38_09075 [Anaerolineales bacterium]|nr:hypothetical protein [Anaerolineales bacterium]